MNLEYIKLTKDRFKEWNDYVKNHKDGTINHLAEWSVINKKSLGLVPLYYLIKKHDKTVGLIPFSQKKGLFTNIYSTIQGGMLLDNPEDIEEIMKELNNLGVDWNSHEIVFSDHPFVIPKLYEDSSNVLVMKEIPEAIDKVWDSVPSKRKNLVRKGLKNNLEIKFIQPEQKDIQEFYKIYARNYRDLGTPVKPISYFTEQIKWLPENIRMLKAFSGPKLIGVMWLHHYKTEMADPEAASIRKYFHTKVNDLMYYKAFEYAAEKGCSLFNMGRSQEGTGTFKFKKSWGSTQIKPIRSYTNKKKKSIEERKNEYQVLINLWKRMPVSLTTYIGPIVRKHFNLE